MLYHVYFGGMLVHIWVSLSSGSITVHHKITFLNPPGGEWGPELWGVILTTVRVQHWVWQEYCGDVQAGYRDGICNRRSPWPHRRDAGWVHWPSSIHLCPLGFSPQSRLSYSSRAVSHLTLNPRWGPIGGVLGNLGQTESWLISDCCGCRTSESSTPSGDLAECPGASQDTTCHLYLGIWFVHLVISFFFPLQAVSKYK